MSAFITIEAARRAVDACGGTYTVEETASRFAEGFTAALEAADEALAKTPETDPTEGLRAILKGVTENIPMDYLTAHDAPGATGPTDHLDLVGAMRAYSAARHRIVQRCIKAERVSAELLEALTGLVAVIDAAGLMNLSSGVQLGQTSWYVKASDHLTAARDAIAKAERAA